MKISGTCCLLTFLTADFCLCSRLADENALEPRRVCGHRGRCPVKLKANWRIAALALFVALQLQTVAKAEPPDSAPAQRFVCNIGYTQKQCEVDVAALRKALAKYPADGLG